jgi:hypothetical protein
MNALFNSTNETSYTSQRHDKNLWNPTTVRQCFIAGPPYMAVGRDMYNIVNTWATIASPSIKNRDHLSDEMFAYVVPSTVDLSISCNVFMVSSVPMGPSEGWKWIDDGLLLRR